MALIVEDGTGKTDADAYVAAAFVTTYQAARGRAAWAVFSSTVKDECVRRATDYIDLRFGARFRGTRRTGTQALEWPRRDAYDNSGFAYQGIPTALQKACAEYALISGLVGELAARPSPPAGTQSVATGVVVAPIGGSGALQALTQIIGPLEESRTFATTQQAPRSEGGLVSAYSLPEYPLADSWLMQLVASRITSRVVGGC